MKADDIFWNKSLSMEVVGWLHSTTYLLCDRTLKLLFEIAVADIVIPI
ncbi:hypothetical protein QUB80_03395 [Chlorogloeopsis sp. ULAP01]|nr:hypothetical protein [Chlorogloeopsis sp. ULAP01]MDM9379743.1 hypothetical protein [Chlorogloeopsis sp. ULAP01]